MELGRFFLGLKVHDVRRSVGFYARLGFRPVSGDLNDGWAIVDNGEIRLGLYRGDGGILINFLDGRVKKIVDDLKEKGIEIGEDEVVVSDDSIGFTIKDPDGNLINFSSVFESWVVEIECPRCGALSEPTGKGFIFGIFEGRSYFCEECEKAFNAFYRDRELSYTVPKTTKASLKDKLIHLTRGPS